MKKTANDKARAIGAGRWLLPFTIGLLSLILSSAAFAQTNKLEGTVKDNKGAPMEGVSVTVKGTRNGVTTDNQGKFSISAASGSILVFSFTGMVTQELKASSGVPLNVTMTENASSLDDVVVIGFGTASKRNVTGSISSVTAKQIEERQPVTLFDALQGQAAGVLVTNDNGDPAGQGTIQIRGASTLNSGNGPLYVIDGIISENGNFLNPADIEKIDILKDASSAAIYGARGANGVILITTKKGKLGKPNINVNYLHLLGELAHKIRTISADELRYYRKMRGDNNGGGRVDSLNPYLNADNDYQDLLFRTAHKNVATLSMGGASKGISYYGGVTYTDDQSIILNSWIKRLQSKINVSYDASPKLSVSHSLAFSWQTGNNIPLFATIRQIFERNPFTSIYRPDGSLASYVESKRNPVAYALLEDHLDNNFTTQFNTRLVYKLTRDLKFTTLFNAQVDNLNSKDLSPAYLTSGGNGDATGRNMSGRNVYWEYQAFMNYDTRLSEKHSLSGLLAFTADRRRDDRLFISSYKYLTEEVYTPNVATIDLAPGATGATATAYSDASVFGRVGYNYDGRYLLDATIRRDASSRFGEKNKWGNFYALSGAWRFTSEKFMDWTTRFLTDGKIRLSHGRTGNDRIGNSNYPWANVIVFGEFNYNGYASAGPSVVLGNSEVHWETTTSTNLGLDLTFLNGRLTFSADAYVKNTSDLLYASELPKETGKQRVNINLGDIRNKGLEFSLSGTPIVRKNFKWDATANITTFKGKITRLYNGTSVVSGKWLIAEGAPIGDFYVWKNLGVYQWDESNAYDVNGSKLTVVLGEDGTPTGAYTLGGKEYTGAIYKKSRNGAILQGGDTEWFDRDNNGVIDDEDKVVAGNATPDYFFGLSSTFTYKNFSLSFLINGQVGNEIYNAAANAQNQNSSTYSPPTWEAALTSWLKPGDVSKYPLFTRKNDRGSVSNGLNSLYIEDGSFVRLSSVRLTYTLDRRIAQKAKMKNATVFVYGSNLLTWTDYSWFDPEFSNNNILQPGEDTGRYPKRRELGIGFNVNF